jgi:uncharacterized protein YjbI with pentapeptide repeats
MTNNRLESILGGPGTVAEEHRFRSIAADGGELSGVDFVDCSFEECSFREISFGACRFMDCTFTDCDMSLARLQGCSFRRSRWKRSKVIGVDWSRADWPAGKPLFASVDFFDCAVSYSSFVGLRLHRLHLVRCVAREVDFSNADLTGADCRETDFDASRFVKTNLTDADFTGARNYVISATSNTLRRTRFSFPEAISLLRALDIVLTE